MTLRSDRRARFIRLWRPPVTLVALISLTIGGWALNCQAAPGDRTGVVTDTDDGGRLPPPGRFGGEQPEFDGPPPEDMGRRFDGGPGGHQGGDFQGRRKKFHQQQAGPDGMPQDMGNGQFGGPDRQRNQFRQGRRGQFGGLRRGQFGEQGEPGGFPGGSGGFPGGPGGPMGQGMGPGMGPGGMQGGMHGGMGPGGMQGGMMMRRGMQKHGGQKLDLTPLALTEEQKTKIQAMREQTKAKAREIRKSMMSKQMEVKNMMFNPDATEAQIRAARKELRLQQERLDDINLNDLLAIRSMLTPDQKKRLPDCMPGRRFMSRGQEDQFGKRKSAAFAQRLETRQSK